MVDGYILAGGASSRMGAPKRELVIAGVTMLERAYAALSAISDGQITAVVEPGYTGGATIPLGFIEDSFPAEYANELPKAAVVGLYSALRHSQRNHVAVIACDLPFVDGEIFRTIYSKIEMLENNRFDVIVPLDPVNRAQPLCAIYSRERSLKTVEASIIDRDLSLHGILSRMNCVEIGYQLLPDLFNTGNVLLNVNTPEDLAEARKIASRAFNSFGPN